MNFNDIFKSSFLENVSSISVLDMLLTIVLSFGIGLFIFLIYKKTYRGVMYSAGFGTTLIALTMITSIVILAVTSNVVLSLGMVGALSIVRFRTAIKDARDTMYIFWAIIVGICCGVSDFLVATIGSAIVFAVLFIFGSIKNDKRMLLIIRADRDLQESIQAAVFNMFERRAVMRVRNTTPHKVEMIYEISSEVLRRAEVGKHSVCDKIYELGNVEYVNIVMQNDEISG